MELQNNKTNKIIILLSIFSILCLGLVLFVSIILGPGLKNLPSGLVSSRNIKMEENGCGSGTKINDEGVCIVDNEDIVNTLIENKFILYDSIKKDVV